MGARRAQALRVVLAVAAVALTGCGGPRRTIEVSVKEIPGDVAIGKKKAAAAPAPLPTAINSEPVGFPSFLQPPPPVRPASAVPAPTAAPTTAPRQPRCRTADPRDPPKVDAPRNVAVPPANQTLEFRNVGTFEVVDRAGHVQKGPYAPLSARQVVSQADGDGTYTFAIGEGTPLTVTTYHLDPARGIYLRGVSSYRADGSVDRFFTPVDSLLLLPLPVTETAPVGGAAVDPISATTMALSGTVKGKTRVDACGTPLEAWEVEITDGRITSPNKQVGFTATYAIATQYGGLSVREVVAHRCDESVNAYCDNGRKVTTQNTATAAAEPKPAAQPAAGAKA